ncbi:MAG TPA: hypothetical protein DEP85_06160 [Holosporales bacterium]|nr:hypothetical protein [Holosporales bacterium]
MNEGGRKPYPDSEYKQWLADMAPFLKSGTSLYRAVEKAGLMTNKDSIYRKYRLKDWFCEKVTMFQSYPGELVNNIFIKRIEALHESVILGKPLNKQDVKLLCFAAAKHRSCQQFFVRNHSSIKSGHTNVEKVVEALGN